MLVRMAAAAQRLGSPCASILAHLEVGRRACYERGVRTPWLLALCCPWIGACGAGGGPIDAGPDGPPPMFLTMTPGVAFEGQRQAAMEIRSDGTVDLTAAIVEVGAGLGLEGVVIDQARCSRLRCGVVLHVDDLTPNAGQPLPSVLHSNVGRLRITTAAGTWQSTLRVSILDVIENPGGVARVGGAVFGASMNVAASAAFFGQDAGEVVRWVVVGDAVFHGSLDVSGASGATGGIAVAGGGRGGAGFAGAIGAAGVGFGAGGGGGIDLGGAAGGGGAGYAEAGVSGQGFGIAAGGSPGSTYGLAHLEDLFAWTPAPVGGSGGGAGGGVASEAGGRGGAGGGGFALVVLGRLDLGGASFAARGGDGADPVQAGGGGGGSGGAITIAAREVVGVATVDVGAGAGGTGGAAGSPGGAGGAGRARVDLPTFGAVGVVAGLRQMGPVADMATLVLLPSASPLAIRGWAPAGSTVAVTNVDSGASARATAAADGTFTVDMPLTPGRNSLVVTALLGGVSYTGYVGNALRFDPVCDECFESARIDVVYVPPVE